MKKVRSIPVAAVIALLLAFVALLSIACRREKPPIKIGFVGGLTGRYADLGAAGRDGALLAVEECNEKGGIANRKVWLISKDDRQDEKNALQVDRELMDEGVAAIIGHMTSSMSVAAVPLMNEKKMVMISPTSTTNALNGKDDYFFRIEPASKSQTESLARYAIERAHLKRISVIYDRANQTYSEDYYQVFSALFTARGGEISAVESYRSLPDASFEKVVARILKAKPEGVLLIANAPDAADLCQQIRKWGSDAVILSSGWAMTEVFLHNGGKAVEGVVFDNLIDIGSQDKRFVDFENRFKKRFGGTPSFGAVHGYEAARLLLDALTINADPAQLKQTLHGVDTVYGLFGDFSLDRFGDARRHSFILTVRDRRFQRLE